ncbi:MAG: transcription antitermination factor NusB [Fibrobacteres bacterium]|jgi:N utilization substance protein B|nr:transcription antitermination factor NusB [Fibrobacterota bacterium]
MISRRRGREFAMQLLYAVEVGKEAFAEALKGLAEDPDLPQDAREYGTRLARKVLESQQDLDARISAAASNWDLDRIAIVDKLIIRCAVAELMYMQDVPLKVAINEAVDIAKKFSTGDSSRFVNGVLDAIAKTFQNPD